MTKIMRITFPVAILFAVNVYAQQKATPPSTSGQTTGPGTVVDSPWFKEMAAGVRETGDDEFDAANESFDDAIVAVKDDEDDPRLPAAINNKGALYQRQGRYNEAEPLHRRALKLREEVLGKEHPDVAQSLNNLATVHVEQRRYSEAILLYERAMAIWEKTRGADYYKIAAGLNNLASVYEVQGQHAKAKTLYDESMALWQKNRGSNDLLYAQSLENYAGLLRTMGDGPAATEATAKAAAIRAEAARTRTRSTN